MNHTKYAFYIWIKQEYKNVNSVVTAVILRQQIASMAFKYKRLVFLCFIAAAEIWDGARIKKMSTQLSLLSLSDDSKSEVPEVISSSVTNASIAFK